MNFDSLALLRKRIQPCPHIIGFDEYFNTSVLVPLVFQNDEYHLLFQKRSASIRQGGEICFPGGKFDKRKDDSLLATAIRETIEEIGVRREHISIIGPLGTLVTNRGVTVDTFTGILSINDLSECIIHEGEVESVFLIPVSFFENTLPERYEAAMTIHSSVIEDDGTERTLLPSQELGLPERYFTSWEGARIPVYVYRTPHGIIWGMTAQIIRAFIEHIRA
ncbi:MAG TPA: CoA pyrophosphatase [Spirochaetota bacterium]